MTKKTKTEKLYAWGDRELTIPQWVLEADVWLRGIDEEILRVRLEGPCVGEPWSVERSLTTPVANDEALLRAEDLVPKAQGRSKDARELNAVRKSLLRLVAMGGVVPERTYRIAAALASDRHRLPPPAPAVSQPTQVAYHAFEVREHSAVRGTRTRMRYWSLVDGINKNNAKDSVFTGTSSGQRLLQINAGTIYAEVLDAEAFPVGTRRMIVILPTAPKKTPT